MPFISPMLASPMTALPATLSPGIYAAEEKFDGHRLIMEVTDAATHDLYGEGMEVKAWGRYGIPRILPPHIVTGMSRLPPGIYDGELLAPGKRSYGVTERTNSDDLVYVIFD